MAELWAQTSIGFCAWDIPVLVILLAVIAVFVVQNRRLKKEERDLKL